MSVSFSRFKSVSLAFLLMAGAFTHAAYAQEASPNEFVKTFSDSVLSEIKARKKELMADPAKLDALIDEKVMPNVDFKKMTQLVVGRSWRTATQEQRDEVTKQFRVLLVKTYSGALTQVGDQTLEVDKPRMRPEDTTGVVTSRVIQKNGPPIDLAYRVEKVDNRWKIYDLSVLGLWLVDSYKAQFGPILSSGGMDALILSLKAKNG
jgi:phospholipid transport system substrate-binding protein